MDGRANIWGFCVFSLIFMWHFPHKPVKLLHKPVGLWDLLLFFNENYGRHKAHRPLDVRLEGRTDNAQTIPPTRCHRRGIIMQ
jgi:hypothetical protein